MGNDKMRSIAVIHRRPMLMNILINTLGDMLGQTEELKMEKFIDTMPTIIQTHLITCKTWAKTTKKVKKLEHIIRKCDPLAAALPNLTKGTAVSGFCIHT